MTGHAAPHPAGPKLRGKRVLIVEDQYLVAIEIERMLRHLGAEVIGPVPDLVQAFAAIEQGAPDFAMLDVNLGDEKVFGIMDRLAQDGIVMILITGYEAWALPSAYRGVPRLEKPVTARALAEMLDQLRLGLPAEAA